MSEDVPQEQTGDEPWYGEMDEDDIITVDNLSSHLPGWVKDLRVLASVSALGVSLTDNPLDFVIAAIQEWLIGGLLTFAGEIGAIFNEMWRLVTAQLVAALLSILDPFGDAGDAVIDAVLEAGVAVDSVAAAGGPLAPLAAVVIWAILVIWLAIVVRTVLTVIKWI